MLSNPKVSLLREDLCGIRSCKWNSWTCIWTSGLSCTQCNIYHLTINYENHSINMLSEPDPSTLLPCEVLLYAAPPPSPAVAHTSFLFTLSAPTLWPPFFFWNVSDFCLSLGFCACCSWDSLSPVFFMTHSFVSFRSQICFPFSEWPSLNGDLLQLLSITPLFTSFIALTAVCNDLIWLFTYHEPASPSRPKSGILSV